MFIGHYSAAFAAKAAKPDIPLWHLFVAVQLVDFVWAGLVLAGIEKANVVPGFLAASPLDLYHMPYTHSLLASCIWALAAMAIYGLMRGGGGKWKLGAVIGAAVLSHWFLDLLVHGPDLQIYPGGEKFGLGLWASLLWSQVAEIGLLILTAIVCFKAVYTGAGPGGRRTQIHILLLLAFMRAIQAYSHLPVSDLPTTREFAVSALLGYSVLSFAAWLAERRRARAAC